MIWNPFKRKPKSIIQTRASHKAFREADREYADKHIALAGDLGRPVPHHLRGYQPKGRGRV